MSLKWSTSSIRVAGERKAWEETWVLLEELRETGLRPDVPVHSALLVANGKARQWQRAMTTLSNQGNIILCNAAFLALNHWQQCFQWLRQIPTRRLQADLISYTSTLKGCESTHWRFAGALLEELTARKLQANSITLSAAMRSGAWAKLMSAYEQSLEMNVVCYSAALSADNDAGWLVATSVLQKLQQRSIESNVIFMNSVSNACEAQWKVALSLLESFRPSSLKPDVVSYNFAIGITATNGTWWNGLKCLEEMRSRWIQCDAISYSSAMVSGHWELALALLSEMVHQKLRWDNISLTCAVRACGSCSEWQVAMQLLTQFHVTHGKLDPGSYGSLISACSDASQWQQALKLLDICKKIWKSPVAYSCAMNGCGKAGRWDIALTLFTAMADNTTEVNLLSFNSLVTETPWRMTSALLEVARTRRLKLNEVTQNCCLKVLGAHSWQMAIEMRRGEPSEFDNGFNLLLMTCSMSEQWQTALALFTNLDEVHSDPVTYSTMMCACGSTWAIALDLLQMLQRQRQFDVLCLSSAITACDMGDQWRPALQLLYAAAMERHLLDSMAYRVTSRALDMAYENERRWRLVVSLFGDLQEQKLEADLAMHTTASKCLCEDLVPHRTKQFPSISDQLVDVSMATLWNLLGSKQKLRV